MYGKDYLLVVDYYSKFHEVCHLHSKTASDVIVTLKSIFARYGIAEELIADNMPFGSAAMRKFAEDWNFKITTTSPNFPQSNGQAERAIQTVKGLLPKAEESRSDPNIALLQYRSSPLAGTSFSPAELCMNRQLTTASCCVHSWSLVHVKNSVTANNYRRNGITGHREILSHFSLKILFEFVTIINGREVWSLRNTTHLNPKLFRLNVEHSYVGTGVILFIQQIRCQH